MLVIKFKSGPDGIVYVKQTVEGDSRGEAKINYIIHGGGKTITSQFISKYIGVKEGKEMVHVEGTITDEKGVKEVKKDIPFPEDPSLQCMICYPLVDVLCHLITEGVATEVLCLSAPAATCVEFIWDPFAYAGCVAVVGGMCVQVVNVLLEIGVVGACEQGGDQLVCNKAFGC